MNNKNRERKDSKKLARSIFLSATNQIQIARLIEVQIELQINPQLQDTATEVSPLDSGIFIMLWFAVLLAKILMFWRVKKKD